MLRNTWGSVMSERLNTDGINANRKENWSRFWAGGSLQACAGGLVDELGNFWRAIAGQIQGAACVLDVATGNGIVPWHLLKYSNDLNPFEIDAIDLANVKPDWWQELSSSMQQRVRFHGGIAAEQLPFSNNSMQWVVSQFGLEYTPLAITLPELRRVLSRDGHLALILHDVDSLIVAKAKEERNHLEWFQGVEFFEKAGLMCRTISRARTAEGRAELNTDQQALSLRSEFNALLRSAKARTETGCCPDVVFEILASVMTLVDRSARFGEADESQVKLQELVRLYSDMHWRLTELLQHAKTKLEAAEIASALGLEITVLEPILSKAGDSLGWGLQAIPR